MKKQAVRVILSVAVLLCAFTAGFYLGRNQNHETLQLTTLPDTALNDFPPETGTLPSSNQYAVIFPVNLNTADIRELTALPGIGETLARRILDYRTFHGVFSAPEELLNVDGIGNSTLEAILDLVTTGG